MKKIEIAKHFKSLIKCDKFILTGSLALSYYGFSVPVKDLDLIVINPSDESIDMLRRLSADNPPTRPGKYHREDLVRFRHDDIDVDVFISKVTVSDVHEWVSVDGIDLNPVSSIIQAKKDINRPKDWIQLRNISRMVFKQEDFDKFMDNF